ncbi:MAG: metal ABC transporter permease [Alphaproteobacteria bacterium]|nr:metal ABC transporter permease [Alphaproteobacteria bacterium]
MPFDHVIHALNPHSIYQIFISPFVDYQFMRYSLYACMSLTLSCTLLGAFLVFKRLSLMGEALSHGILPGVALAFMGFGISTIGFSVGGIIAGLLVLILGFRLSKNESITQDGALSVMYIIFLSIGYLLLSKANTGVHLMHILFGNVLAIDHITLQFIIIVSLTSFLLMLLLAKPLLLASFDPILMRLKGYPVGRLEACYLFLVVINLVAACQAIGTLMALGIMLLPAITSRLLCHQFNKMILMALSLGIVGNYLGILISYHYNLSTGPTIILVLGTFFALSYVTQTKHRHNRKIL